MYIRTPFLLLLFPFFMQAQYSQLLRDKDVIWMAEVVEQLRFDPGEGSAAPGFLEALPLKALQEDYFAPHPTPFSKGLFEIMQQGRWPAYYDAELTLPIGKEALQGQMMQTDTVVVFDPETYEEKITVVKSELLGSSNVFALRELLYYNAKTGELGAEILAIAPTWNDGEPEPAYRPLAWFKVPPADKKLFKLASKNVPFATFVRQDLDERDMKVVKGADMPLKAILFSQLQSGKITGYDSGGRAIAPPLVPALFSSTDTIITFDPETYEESVEMVHWDYTPQDVGNYRFKQSFFFDPRQGKLQCRPEAVAPAINVTDEFGQLLYLQPLFYWRRDGR